jgi:hypothetical protein
MCRNWTASQRKRIKTLLEKGENYNQISQKVGVSKDSVRRFDLFKNDQFAQYEDIHGVNIPEPIKGKVEIPEGHKIKGISKLVDQEGNDVLTWIKTREDVDNAQAAIDLIKDAFKDYKGKHQPVDAPVLCDRQTVTLYPLVDWHIGMFSWGQETGVNWDLKIAENTIGQGMEDLIERSPPSKLAIILGGGDMLHADNQSNRTAHSGNALDVDGRWAKVLMAANRLIVRNITAALRKHEEVVVRILPGNHDEHSSFAIAYFLLAWYRDEPRVTVDVDPSLFFYFRFGKVLLGSTHGHLAKAKDLPMVMASRRAEDWGLSKHRYIHTFHLHHDRQTVTEGGGCVTEIHRTPAPQDAWHYGSGFLSARSMKSITYHQEYGEVSRSTVAIVDNQPQKKAVKRRAA